MKSAQKSIQNKKVKASQSEIKAPKNESNPKFYTTKLLKKTCIKTNSHLQKRKYFAEK